jgi:hypothetical protein
VGVDGYDPIIKYLKKGYFDHDVTKEEKKKIIIRVTSYIMDNCIN